MKKQSKLLSSILLTLLISLPLTLAALAAEENPETPAGEIVTVTGEVNDNYQLITNEGVVYEIGVSDAGDELIRYPGARAKVEGQVIEEEGLKTIYVTAYHLIRE